MQRAIPRGDEAANTNERRRTEDDGERLDAVGAAPDADCCRVRTPVAAQEPADGVHGHGGHVTWHTQPIDGRRRGERRDDSGQRPESRWIIRQPSGPSRGRTNTRGDFESRGHPSDDRDFAGEVCDDVDCSIQQVPPFNFECSLGASHSRTHSADENGRAKWQLHPAGRAPALRMAAERGNSRDRGSHCSTPGFIHRVEPSQCPGVGGPTHALPTRSP